MGNPGSGKSTLANALLGKIHFKAGATANGEGVTKEY